MPRSPCQLLKISIFFPRLAFMTDRETMDLSSSLWISCLDFLDRPKETCQPFHSETREMEKQLFPSLWNRFPGQPQWSKAAHQDN